MFDDRPPVPETSCILLADDNVVNRMVLAGLLMRLGSKVETVVDGVAALRRWDECEFDAVLMDLYMPRLDGLGAIAEIRRREAARARARTPIMLLTADDFPETRVSAFAAGADHVATKPLDLDGLSNALGAILPRPLARAG